MKNINYFLAFGLITALIYFGIEFTIINFHNSNETVEIIESDSFTIINNQEEGIRGVIFTDTIDLELFAQTTGQANSFEFVYQSQEYDFAINAGYFQPDYTHAGLLRIDSNEMTTIATNDRQLTHIFRYFNGRPQIFDINTYLSLSSRFLNGFEFQTGPLIIDKNELQNDFIDNSLNGNGNFRRSIIGYTESGKIMIFITTKPFDLKRLGTTILSLDDLEGEILTLLNLDGGSSVAFYAKESPNLTSGENKLLPFVLGINLISIDESGL